MLNNVSSSHSATHQRYKRVWQRLSKLLLRKVWLPRSIYTALPYTYIALGCYAIFAGLYLTGWNWAVPYLILLGMICLHAGITVFTLRRQKKNEPGRSSGNLRE